MDVLLSNLLLLICRIFMKKQNFLRIFFITHELKKGIHPCPFGMINLSNIISYGRGTLPNLIEFVIRLCLLSFCIFFSMPIFATKKASKRLFFLRLRYCSSLITIPPWMTTRFPFSSSKYVSFSDAETSNFPVQWRISLPL